MNRSSAGDHVDSYFVCGTPRTGSSLLLGLLDSTGVAGHPQAYFREPDETLWADRWRLPRTASGSFDYADYVRAALNTGRTDNGVFSAKLMWGTLDELVEKLGRVHPDLAGDATALLHRAFGRTRFVYVHRADTLAQAVSWLRADQTQLWYAGGNGEISGDPEGNGQEPIFDADSISHFLRLIREHNAAWQDWFASHGIHPHVVRYEQLAKDLTGTTLAVLTFLGLSLPEGNTVTPHHRRQADDLNRQWIARYRGTSPL